MSGVVVSIDIFFFMHRSPLFIYHSLDHIESFESILSRSNENGSLLNKTKMKQKNRTATTISINAECWSIIIYHPSVWGMRLDNTLFSIIETCSSHFIKFTLCVCKSAKSLNGFYLNLLSMITWTLHTEQHIYTLWTERFKLKIFFPLLE